MNTQAHTLEKEHSERGHDPGACCEDDNASLEYQAQALAATYKGILYTEGEVVIGSKTHTWQEVIDEDLDNILDLQRALHRTHCNIPLEKAQTTAVDGWAIRTAREQVGL